MNEIGSFNIESTERPVNSNIVTVFSPSLNVKTYTYQVYKDGKIIKKSDAISTQSEIIMKDSGKYHIIVEAILNDETSQKISSGEYIIDKESPIIEVKKDNLIIKENVKETIEGNAKAYDNYDGDIKIDYKNIDLKENTNQKLIYTAVDRAGNVSEKEINVNVSSDYNFFLIMNIVFAAIIFIILFLILKVYKSLKIEKRVEPFIVKSLNQRKSISEKLIESYQIFLVKFNKAFEKSVFIERYAKKLEKYVTVTNIHKSGKDIFSGKVIIGFVFSVIAFFSKIINFEIISYYEEVVIFTVGFFLLDVLYFIKYKVYRWKVESDFISAITIMNNAFKSGRSISQAIDTVAKELKGPMGREFNRMSLELLYGLGIDVVFKRFAKRINLEEANYLTASLTILNKTGGDIVKVFDSIERSMFDRRKLRLELSSLTSGSKIVVGVLLGMPFFFCLVISMINPDYFIPFFSTGIGIILLLVMIIYYIIFAITIRKILRVVI